MTRDQFNAIHASSLEMCLYAAVTRILAQHGPAILKASIYDAEIASLADDDLTIWITFPDVQVKADFAGVDYVTAIELNDASQAGELVISLVDDSAHRIDLTTFCFTWPTAAAAILAHIQDAEAWAEKTYPRMANEGIGFTPTPEVYLTPISSTNRIVIEIMVGLSTVYRNIITTPEPVAERSRTYGVPLFFFGEDRAVDYLPKDQRTEFRNMIDSLRAGSPVTPILR